MNRQWNEYTCIHVAYVRVWSVHRRVCDQMEWITEIATTFNTIYSRAIIMAPLICCSYDRQRRRWYKFNLIKMSNRKSCTICVWWMNGEQNLNLEQCAMHDQHEMFLQTTISSEYCFLVRVRFRESQPMLFTIRRPICLLPWNYSISIPARHCRLIKPSTRIKNWIAKNEVEYAIHFGSKLKIIGFGERTFTSIAEKRGSPSSKWRCWSYFMWWD